MSVSVRDCRLLDGGRGEETEIPAHLDSPTWIVDEAYDAVEATALTALDAYMEFCQSWGYPHSHVLGLDILVTGRASADGRRVEDIRPTLLEGPCCNSYPACPSFFASRLHLQAVAAGHDLDAVKPPVHPLAVLDELVRLFAGIWETQDRPGKPIVGVLTRPYADSEEETAHVEVLQAFEEAGYRALRITPDEEPDVRQGKLFVGDTPIDLCYRRIERVHVPAFFGWRRGLAMVCGCPNTVFVNPWEVDDLRSKTVEERAFRQFEARTGRSVSRPRTLLGREITPQSVRSLLLEGGFAFKKWNSTGGKGVFLHVWKPLAESLYRSLYGRFDGRHMTLLDEADLDSTLVRFDGFTEDVALQQMRVIDARPVAGGQRLVYDTRVNCFYQPAEGRWQLVSGLSRVVPCGEGVTNGNSLLTNVSSGAHLAPLILGHTTRRPPTMTRGPLLEALHAGRAAWEPSA